MVADMLCCEWERPAAGRVLLGHAGNKVSVFDLSTSSIASVVLFSVHPTLFRHMARCIRRLFDFTWQTLVGSFNCQRQGLSMLSNLIGLL